MLQNYSIARSNFNEEVESYVDSIDDASRITGQQTEK